MKQTSDYSEIQQFYNGATVFITGATGFLGKLLLEKFLRLAEIKHIYLLIREKDGDGPQIRLNNLYESSIFDQVKRLNPDFTKKVTVIPGDCELDNLGISIENSTKLIQNVDCVFHLAGNTDPDQSLVSACRTNVKSTKALLVMATQMKQLKCMVYLSSVYAHLKNKRVHEEFYNTPITGANLVKIVDNVQEETVEALKQKLTEDYANVHLFTKAVTEDLLRNQGRGLPIAIVRASFATAAYEEPMAGYAENYNGPTGLLLGKNLGVIKITPMQSQLKVDIVPADYVVSTILAVGWHTSNSYTTRTRSEIKAPADIQIYHCVSSEENPITWNELEDKFFSSYEKQPSKRAIWYPISMNTSCIYNFMLMSFLLHTVPAYIGHYIGLLFGKHCCAVQAYEKVGKFLKDMQTFTMNEFEFTNDKSVKLLNKLAFKDRKLFNFDMHTISWESYVAFYAKGCRVYILKDELDDLAEALKRYQRLKILHYITVTIFGILGYFFIRCGVRCVLKRYFNIVV